MSSLMYNPGTFYFQSLFIKGKQASSITEKLFSYGEGIRSKSPCDN